MAVQKSDVDDSVEGTEKAMYSHDYVMSVHDGALNHYLLQSFF
jgi:hypothetical protein